MAAVLAAGATKCSSSDSPVQDPAEHEQLCGGYTEQRALTAEDLALFNETVDTAQMAYTPVSVATQVVSGMNYKYFCSYSDPASGKTGNCWIIIYKPLQGNPILSAVIEAQ